MKKKGRLPKIVVVVGPTASGKSALAVKLAKRFDGEIVSADSRQVYTGLDVGSGKVSKKEMAGIPHHLLSVANPRRQFSVTQYQKLANKAIIDILKRGKLPIVVGGTGFYIQAIADNVVLPEVPPNLILRKKLEKKNTVELYKILKKLDPARAKDIDQHNPRRLVRAIEIATALGKVPKLKSVKPKYRTLQIGLDLKLDILRQKINKRTANQLKQGMIGEVKKLKKNGLSWKRLDNIGLEYRFVAQHLQSKISKADLLPKLQLEVWHYAKRQLTWFKKDKRIKWVQKEAEAISLIKSFLLD